MIPWDTEAAQLEFATWQTVCLDIGLKLERLNNDYIMVWDGETPLASLATLRDVEMFQAGWRAHMHKMKKQLTPKPEKKP